MADSKKKRKKSNSRRQRARIRLFRKKEYLNHSLNLETIKTHNNLLGYSIG
jgi:hypothetical protein